MKLLLDENVPQGLRFYVPGHDVYTVGFMGWKGVRNGDLLDRAGAQGFDAMITMDRAMRQHVNRGDLPVAVVILIAYSNKLPALLPLVPPLLSLLRRLPPRTCAEIEPPPSG